MRNAIKFIWSKNKPILIVLLILIVFLVGKRIYSNRYYKTVSEIGHIDKTLENTADNTDITSEIKYQPFDGEDVDLTTLDIGTLSLDDNGYNFYPHKGLNDIYNVYIKTTQDCKLEDKTMSLTESLKYNDTTSEILNKNVIKSYSADGKDSETLEITAYTYGKISSNIVNFATNISANSWDRANEIFKAELTNLGLADSDINNILKSKSQAGIEISYNESNKVTISVSKEFNNKCNIQFTISNNTDNIETNTVYDVIGYESIDGILEKVYTLPNENKDYTFEKSDNTLGSGMNDEAAAMCSVATTGNIVEITFNGVKDKDGKIVNEELNFSNTANSEDGNLEFMTSSSYSSGGTTNEFDISINNGTFNDAEKERNDNILVKFANYIDSHTEIDSVEKLGEKNDVNQTAQSITGFDGKVYLTAYGYTDEAYALNIINHTVEFITRSKGFESYK